MSCFVRLALVDEPAPAQVEPIRPNASKKKDKKRKAEDSTIVETEDAAEAGVGGEGVKPAEGASSGEGGAKKKKKRSKKKTSGGGV